MTESVIWDMPAGREMDALVAEKAMGFHHITTGVDYPDRCFGIPAQWHRTDKSQIIPRYSNDIVAAWEVLEYLSNKYECATAVGREYPYGRMMYTAFIRGGNRRYGTIDHTLSATAETAPLAICRMALLAVME